MSITADMLTQRASKVGLPITKNAFEGTLENPVPNLPYMVYLVPYMAKRGADLIYNLVTEDWDLEVYVEEENEEAKLITDKIESEVLYDVDYEKYVSYIESEECYQIAYEVKGLLRKVKGKIK